MRCVVCAFSEIPAQELAARAIRPRLSGLRHRGPAELLYINVDHKPWPHLHIAAGRFPTNPDPT